MNFTRENVKKKCPYMEKCYRKNPIHFNEMSHPHLEELLINQLDDAIQIPEQLNFECTDRSQLLDQLKVLQMVLRKERDKCTDSFLLMTKNETSNTTTSPTVLSSKNKINDDLKEKVNRHQKATALRRDYRLKEMDAKAEALATPSTSNASNNESDSTGFSKVREKLDDLKIAEDNFDKFNSQSKKRTHKPTNDNKGEIKKIKVEAIEDKSVAKNNIEKKNSNQEKTRAQQSSSSSKGTSLIDTYNSCQSGRSREEMRKKAIDMMKYHGFEGSVVEPGEFALKHALSAPYHLFYTRIHKSESTHDQQFSITFPEILDRSLGEIVHSLHINFMVDVGWLCLQYLLAGQRTDMMILYGERVDEEKLGLNITMIPVNTPTKFGCHHSKVMIIKYKNDGIRVVVSTANLYSDDWENRTQGLWISPHLPPLPESANPSCGESPTGFKKDFERYLSKYREPAITEWICSVRRADFSTVNVFFLASVPGSHKDIEYNAWGHRKLASVLSKHASLPPDAPQWPIVAQASSIGSLGVSYESWLLKEVIPSMSREKTQGLKSHPNFQFIYPTISNYKESYDCQIASCCLPYSLQTHSKQKWIESYMYQWKAERTGRDKSMPHIKSYTRFSPDLRKIAWFVLTSGNLSKAAWGSSRGSHYIASYEVGVIFLPKLMVGSTTFPVNKEDESGVPGFPIPYDLPLTRYGPQDKPFVTEFFEGYE